MCCKIFWKRIIPFALTCALGLCVVSWMISTYYKPQIYSIVLKGEPVFLKKPNPSYTEEAIKNKTEGKVTLNLKFNKLGKVENVEVIEGLPDGLTERTVEAAREIEVEPLKFLDQSHAFYATINYNFKIGK